MTNVHGEQIDIPSLVTELQSVGAVLSTPTITLVVETGAVVLGANSYVAVNDAVTYCAARGVSLGSNSDAVIILLIKAADWLNSKEQAFQGKRVSVAQSLSWPRTDACLFDDDILDTVIPDRVKQAQCELVRAMAQNIDILPNGSDGNIRRERITAQTEIEYFQGVSIPSLPTVDRLLKPLYISRGYGLTTARG